MRSKAIIMCPLCGQDRWRFAEATYVRALLEEDDEDLTEGGGVVRILCDTCGHLVLFDAETVGIRGSGPEEGTCSPRITGGDYETQMRPGPHRTPPASSPLPLLAFFADSLLRSWCVGGSAEIPLCRHTFAAL